MSSNELSDQKKYQHFVPQAKVSTLFPNAYNFYLVHSIEELKNIIDASYLKENCPYNYVAFDTETTGLDMDEDYLVGYSFCFNGVDAYYVPVNHAEYELEDGTLVNDSLGEEAVDIFYNRMLKANMVLMFNARFDIRVFEKYGFIEHNIPYIERDEKQIYKYDMSKVPYFDVQALIYLTDTNESYPSLKSSEEWYLGWRGASFEDTLGSAENFHYLKPSECYQYAAVDALGTYLLYMCTQAQNVIREVTDNTKWNRKYERYKNRRNSLELDNDFLYPLKIMEDEKTYIDQNLIQGYSDYYEREIKRVQDTIYRISSKVGITEFNIGSPKQKSEVFKALGITTCEYDGTPAVNKRGELKADKEHIGITIDKLGLDKNDEKRIFMESLLEYSTLTKQKGTYTDTFLEKAKESNYNSRLRFSYKTIVVPSGRLAAGGDKKNKYFMDANIQNIPKPHMGYVYYIRYDDLIRLYPEVKGKYDNRWEEYEFNGEHTYRILDWVFKETIWNLPDVKEKKIEAFFQHLNMRSAFTPDDNCYWVSCDYSGQELRAAALLSGEPSWVSAFQQDKDIHKSTAISVWGLENYSKEKRKKAKAVNFG